MSNYNPENHHEDHHATISSLRVQLIDAKAERDLFREEADHRHVSHVTDFPAYHELKRELEEAREALEALRSLMKAPRYASRDALDQWESLIDAALSPNTEGQQ